MARRKSNDNFLKYIIMGFAAVVVIMSATLIILNITEEPPVEYEYSQFQHLSDFSQFDSQNETTYGVYYYQESCGGCIAAKQDTLSFATDNNLNMKVYLVDATTTTDNNNAKAGIVFSGEALRYTPTMLIYTNGELVDMIVGSDNLIPFYNDVENGNY